MGTLATPSPNAYVVGCCTRDFAEVFRNGHSLKIVSIFTFTMMSSRAKPCHLAANSSICKFRWFYSVVIGTLIGIITRLCALLGTCQCDSNATCIDESCGFISDYKCLCNKGYTGDGFTCEGNVVTFIKR